MLPNKQDLWEEGSCTLCLESGQRLSKMPTPAYVGLVRDVRSQDRDVREKEGTKEVAKRVEINQGTEITEIKEETSK